MYLKIRKHFLILLNLNKKMFITKNTGMHIMRVPIFLRICSTGIDFCDDVSVALSSMFFNSISVGSANKIKQFIIGTVGTELY